MSRPWMPLYVADYLADTGHLSAAEHGSYLLLIMHYWQKGTLPNDDRRLASIARATPEQWSDMRDTIAEFFGDGWTHSRIDEELAEAEKKYQKRAEAGRKGGKAKAEVQQSSSNATSNARAGLNQPQPQPHKKEDANASSRRARATPPEFDDWYSMYPHKVQRGAAEKAFAAARKIASLDDLISGLHRYIASKPEDRQWQNPATWLNGKGWLDEPAGPPIRNARWPIAPPDKAGVSGAAQRIMESEGNGSEGIFGSHSDAQRLPATGSGRPRNAASDLSGGIGRQYLTIDH